MNSTLDEFGALPWIWAFGEPAERILPATELDVWIALRSAKCGHKDELSRHCHWCRGTMRAIAAFSRGSETIRVYPG